MVNEMWMFVDYADEILLGGETEKNHENIIPGQDSRPESLIKGEKCGVMLMNS